MLRIHVLGLPRSGTTALSKVLAERLDLPLVVEPIFLWTDGFRLDLSTITSQSSQDIQRIRNKMKVLSRVFHSSGGFVEKTPSSVFAAPVLDNILSDSVIIVISRDRDEIICSLKRMIFDGKDGNMSSGSNFSQQKLKARLSKALLLIQFLGPFEGIAVLIRFFSWSRRNGIWTLSTPVLIERFVDSARTSLDSLNIGSSNRMLEVSYTRFRDDPFQVVEEIASFCQQPKLE